MQKNKVALLDPRLVIFDPSASLVKWQAAKNVHLKWTPLSQLFYAWPCVPGACVSML